MLCVMHKTLVVLKRPIFGVVWDRSREVWKHLEARLVACQFEFKLVSSCAEVLEVIGARQTDIIILSDGMAADSSLEAIRSLRSNISSKDLPLLILSASRDTAYKEELFEAGISDFLNKPFPLQELLARIRNLVGAFRMLNLLEESNAGLDHLVQQRTAELFEANRALTLANSQLEVVDELKNRFLGLISHELRTPLNGVFGAMELMQASSDSVDETILEIYSRSRQRVEDLIADSVLLARLNKGGIAESAVRIDLSNLLAVAASDFGSQQISLDPLPELPVDTVVSESTLLLLLRKMLEMAEKFRVSSPVSVSADVEGGLGKMVVGVPQAKLARELQDRFFEPFEVGEHETSARDLGLRPALAGAFVAMLRGTISVSDGSDGALWFVMEFPLAKDR